MANQSTPVIQIKDSNVGIGTTAPLGPLEVYRSASGALGGHIIINNNGSAVANETALMFGDGAINGIRAAISSTTENSPYYGDIKFKTGASVYSSLTTQMMIKGGGNVLIGTTTDAGFKLDVNGTGRFNGQLQTTQGGRTLFLGDGSFANHINVDSNVDFAFNYNNGNTGGFGFFAGGTTAKFYITNSGNVLIGTTTDAGFKLDVYGTGRFTSRLTVNATSGGNGIDIVGRTDGFGFLSFKNNANNAINAEIGVSDAQNLLFYIGSTLRLTLGSTGTLNLSAYGSGSKTGTVAYNLAVDSSGNIIETAGGVVDGSGTANYVTKWQDANTVTNSQMFDNGTNVGIGTTSPLSKLDVSITSSQALFVANESGTITDGDLLGAVSFGSRDGSTYSSGGITNIRSYATSTYNTGSVSGDIRFYVSSSLQNTTQAALFGTEAMRITAGGNLLIGTTTDSGFKLNVNGGTYSESITTAIQGINVDGYGFLTQTISGEMTLLGHNVRSSTSTANTALVVNSGWISSMIKQYYNDGITFHTDTTMYNAGDVYPMAATERMRITPGGNVGIGTNAPAYKVDVRSITTDPVAFFGFSQTASASNGLIKLNSGRIPQGGGDFSGESGIIFGHSGGTGGVNFDGQGGYIKSIRLNTYAASAQSDSALVFATSNDNVDAEIVRITNTGNVLIGTTTDSGYKLRVNGTAAIESTLRLVGNIQVGSDTTQWSLTGVANGGAIWQKTHSGAGGFDDRYLRLGNVDNNGTPNYVLTVFNSNVGIGTTNPSTQLHISGTTTNITITDTTYGRTSNVGYIDSANLYFANDANSNTYIGRYNGVFLAYGGGNVLIGTTTDLGYKLRVAGGDILVDYSNGLYARNSIANIALLARVSNTSGIINFAEYAAAANINGYVVGSTAAQVKGVFADNKIEFFTSAAVKATLDSSGNFGIGTVPSAGIRLHVLGDTLMQSGSLGVGVNPNATDGRIDASNDIVAYSTSDKRLKENITPIPFALDKVKALTGVMFDWKEETKQAHGHSGRDTGIIAQEVQAVMPTAVRTNDTGYLAVRYEKLIGLLIEAVKEQQAEIDELKKLIK